jgi:miniconductance mechanosensitive channel
MGGGSQIAEFLNKFVSEANLLNLALILAAAAASFAFVRYYIVRSIYRGMKRTKTEWDDILAKNGVFRQISYLAPGIVLYFGAEYYPSFVEISQKIVTVYIAVNVVIICDRSLSAALEIYDLYPVSKKQPIKAYVQLAKLIIYIFGAVTVVSFILDRSPWGVLGGLGAMMAVLILVFRSTIISLIAGIQLIANDLVHIGDWIEVPDSDADGVVVDMALHTIRVENFDKTIIAVPTYRLIEGSFKNWRGMRETGGRRIKRSLLIDQTSVRFCDEGLLRSLKTIDLLKPYLDAKFAELDRAGIGEDEADNDTALLNRRVLTNLGTFRAYAVAYLNQLSMISPDLTLLVRQLQPTPDGLPLEIYAFSVKTEWAEYEGVQADIFDHLIAAIPHFDLRIFQQPTGRDLQEIAR